MLREKVCLQRLLECAFWNSETTAASLHVHLHNITRRVSAIGLQPSTHCITPNPKPMLLR